MKIHRDKMSLFLFSLPLFLRGFLIFIITLSLATSAFAFGGHHHRYRRESAALGVDAVGFHYGGDGEPDIVFGECNWGDHSYMDEKGVCQCEEDYELQDKTCVKKLDDYCKKTNASGDCVEWAKCEYESSGDIIVGIPDADGGCAEDNKHKIVCLDTNDDGLCVSWNEPCLKTDEYHEIIGTPNARSFCCDSGTAHCDYYDDQNQCVLWNCKKTCSVETDWQYCSQLECEALGNHIIWDSKRSLCRYEDGYDPEQENHMDETDYCKKTDSSGDCVEWAKCGYESSGNRVVGVPNAEGACAEGDDYHVVCLRTDSKGNCISWDGSCLKTDEHHEVLGIPNAQGICCEPGHGYCAETNTEGECTLWLYMEYSENVSCPKNYIYDVDAEKCYCPKNHYLDNEKCVPCAEGLISEGRDNKKCVQISYDCPPNEVYNKTAKSCECPDNFYMKDGIFDGRYTSGGVCTPCPENSTSAGPNAIGCIPVSNSSSGYNEESCNALGSYFSWETEKDACRCADGYHGVLCKCSIQEQEYCSQRNDLGECIETSCCAGGVITNVTKPDICRVCPKNIPSVFCLFRNEAGNCSVPSCGYDGVDCKEACFSRYDSGVCQVSTCCEDNTEAFLASGNVSSMGIGGCCAGTVTKGIGEDGADVCCPLGYTGTECNVCVDGYQEVEEQAEDETTTHKCICPDNYYISDKKCIACPEGQISKGPDAEACGFACTTDNDCENYNRCVNGACVSACGKNERYNTVFNRCDCPSNYYISDGVCTACPNKQISDGPNATECGVICKNNNDCEEDEYCAIQHFIDIDFLDGAYDDVRDHLENTCAKPEIGMCKKIKIAAGPVAVNRLGNLTLSQDEMTWYGADNWCKAQNLSLIDVRRLDCFDGDNGLIKEDSSISRTDCHPASEALYDLHRALDGLAFWTASKPSTSVSSCGRYYCETSNRIQYVSELYDGYAYLNALCSDVDTEFVCEKDSDCGECSVCKSGQCVSCAENNRECGVESRECYCPKGSYITLGACRSCKEDYGEKYGSLEINSTQCVRICTSYLDCEEKEYCKFRVREHDYIPKLGECAAIQEVSDPLYIQDLGTMVYSGFRMSWWSANDWCQAQGMNLIDVSRFDCHRNDKGTLITSESFTANYGCCAEGKMCLAEGAYHNEDANWYDDETIREKFSPIMQRLRAHFTKGRFWTATASRGMAGHWTIVTSEANVGLGFYTSTYSALCEYSGCIDCNKTDCEGLGEHFVWNEAKGTCVCADGYQGPSCVPQCDERHTGDLCYQCAHGYSSLNVQQPEGAGMTAPFNCKCESGHIVNGFCVSCPDDWTNIEVDATQCFKTCYSYADCEQGQYCKSKYKDEGKSMFGVCTDFEESSEPVNIESLGTVIRSEDIMPWVSADDWCKAHGKNLIDISEFGCYNRDGSLIETGTVLEPYFATYCSTPEGEASCGPWQNYWIGNELNSEVADSVNAMCSPVTLALRKAYGGRQTPEDSTTVWTATHWEDGNYYRSFSIELDSNLVEAEFSYFLAHALCK